MACCVRGYHEYKDIKAAATREVLVCGRWRTVVGKIFAVKLYSVRYFRMFSVYENIFATKKKRITVYFMYRSLQYVIFTSCNVVVLRRIILYCNIGQRVKDGVSSVLWSSAVARSQMVRTWCYS